MIGIVIVAHGGLAREYRRALEHVVGPQENLRSVTIEDSDDRSAKSHEIRAAADEVDQGDGVVVVTDLFGGSPSNLSLPACAVNNRVILYGANLPMLVKLAKLRHLPADQAAALAAEAGRKYIDSYNVFDDVAPEAPSPRTIQ
ncbi:MAG: PTS fructose transporter subunit IIA [Paracoccus sp. (in: a-proteobacteria)]|nr:PTS fructose transporter subunit IIA [Paracoccus sp. (in: a-proteobacteria)]